MTASDVTELARTVGDVSRFLAVLDFDGTLSPIVEDPAAAELAPGAREAIAQLAQVTDVAILSGRHVDDLAPRIQGLPVFLLGGHGTEVAQPDGSREPLFDAGSRRGTLDRLESELRALLDEANGWVVEPKPASIAVHHRRVDEAASRALLPQVRTVMRDTPGEWELLDGKAVTELRPAGVDKGTAIAWLADRFPDRRLLVLGDDVTDEDAFRAANERGGLTVLVERSGRDSAADHRIRDPAAVVDLLRALVTGTSAR